MAASAYFDQVQQLYIAYFGRPADTVGLAYWAAQIDAANGNAASVIAGFASSTESNALYSGVATSQKVSAIYMNLFNRQPEAAGLAYWVAQIDSGKVTQAQAAYQIQSSAGAGDAAAVANKLAVAKAFTAQLDTAAEIAGYSGAMAAASARAFLAQVDATAYGLNLGTTGAAAAVAAASGVPIAPVTPVIPASPFSVTENAVTHVLEFSGSATGAVTLNMPDATHASFSRGGNTTDVISLASVKGINVPTDAISITAAQAANLATANVAQKIVFDAGDAVTITGIASVDETAALTSFTQTNIGGSSVTLNATDGNWSVTGAALTTALAAHEKLAGALTVTAIASIDEAAALTSFTTTTTGASSVLLTAADATWSVAASSLTTALAANTKFAGNVTVTGIASANETAALTSFTAANVGATAVVLDAADTTWSLSAATLASATSAGISLATGNIVSISNTLTQGLKVIGAGNFQSTNDKLLFSATELTGALGFTSAGTGTITFGASGAELVIATGGALVASGAEAAFLFDTATGKLSFDADGTGAAAAIDLVTLTGVTSLAANDFVIA